MSMSFADMSPWLRLDEALLAPLVKGQPTVHLRRKHPLYYQGDRPSAVYVVKEGRVCVTTYSKAGMEQQLYIAEQGALFGERACILSIPHFSSAVSIVDSTVYAISCGAFLERLEQNPELNQILMRILCRKNSMLIGRLLSQSSTVALQRIAQTLIDMAQEYGIETEDGLEISIRFSHQDVANLLHTSRVTVTKAFQSMTQVGILLRKDNRILVRDRERLVQLAAGTLSL